ncbi:MAG: insulinase family protein [Akkermansiaceae bacterium]|nr:insulinase family protein [Akkermansiaceae bacterium]
MVGLFFIHGVRDKREIGLHREEVWGRMARMQGEVYTCKNGLTVIVNRQTAFPVVSVQVWVGTGAEHEGEHAGAGVSHLIEHMVFKGTAELNAQQLNEEVAALGGIWNAYTGTDRTVYHIDGPATHCRRFTEILLQLVFSPCFPIDEFEKEREVIRREMAMYNDDPQDASYRALVSTLYKVHPKRRPVIGELKRFDALTHQDMVNYHRNRYTPGNMFVCVAGDVEPAAVFNMVEEAVATIPARATVQVPTPSEPRQWGSRLHRTEFAQPTSTLMLAWRIPHARHADAAPLAVLASVLGDGRAAWLYKKFHDETALAHDVSASIMPDKEGEGAFIIEADAERANRDRLRDELLDYVAKLPHADFNQGIQRALRQIKAQRLRTLATVQGQAALTAICWHRSRNLQADTEWAEALQRVTTADIARVCTAYLSPERLTEVSVDPVGSNPTPASAAATHGLPAPVEHELPNGLRLIMRVDKRVPMVYTHLTMAAGCRTETAATAGINNLLAECLLKGTTTRTAAEMADAVENLGGYINCNAGNNTLALSTRALAEDATTMMELLADAALHPTFPEEAVALAREDMEADVLDSLEDPAALAFRHIRRACFGNTSYGNHPDGTVESIRTLTREHLVQQHARLVCAGNAVLVVCGDFDPACIAQTATRLFADMPAGEPAAGVPTPPQMAADTVIACDKEQAVLALAIPGTTATADDQLPQSIFAEWCRDMSGPIFTEIREKLGLAYYAAAAELLGTDAGCLYFYLGTAPQMLPQAREALEQLLAQLAQEGMPAEALERTRSTMLTQRLLHEQSGAKTCAAMAVNTVLGLPADYADTLPERLAAITHDQMQAWIRHTLATTTRTWVSVTAPIR